MRERRYSIGTIHRVMSTYLNRCTSFVGRVQKGVWWPGARGEGGGARVKSLHEGPYNPILLPYTAWIIRCNCAGEGREHSGFHAFKLAQDLAERVVENREVVTFGCVPGLEHLRTHGKTLEVRVVEYQVFGRRGHKLDLVQFIGLGKGNSALSEWVAQGQLGARGTCLFREMPLVDLRLNKRVLVGIFHATQPTG